MHVQQLLSREASNYQPLRSVHEEEKGKEAKGEEAKGKEAKEGGIRFPPFFPLLDSAEINRTS